jgi:hypothetical protein
MMAKKDVTTKLSTEHVSEVTRRVRDYQDRFGLDAKKPEVRFCRIASVYFSALILVKAGGTQKQLATMRRNALQALSSHLGRKVAVDDLVKLLSTADPLPPAIVQAVEDDVEQLGG